MSKKDDKAGKDKKGKKGKGAGSGGPSVANHPRARAQVRMAKGWGGLIGFVIAAYMAHKAQVPFAIAGFRALAAGVAGYVVALCSDRRASPVVAELRAAAEPGGVIPQAGAAEQSGS
jgi:hypothetical protein